MLQRLPVEILDIVLSFLASPDLFPEPQRGLSPEEFTTYDGRLDNLSETSRRLRDNVRNFRLSRLRLEIERVASLDLLTLIWKPFFDLERQSTASDPSSPHSQPTLREVVLNKHIYRKALLYIKQLQHRDRIASEMTEFLLQLPDLQLSPLAEPTHERVKTTVMRMWGTALFRNREAEFGWGFTQPTYEEMNANEVFMQMDEVDQHNSCAIYEVWTARLSGPFSVQFGSVIENTGGDLTRMSEHNFDLHVYRVIVTDGMEEVLRLMKESEDSGDNS